MLGSSKLLVIDLMGGGHHNWPIKAGHGCQSVPVPWGPSAAGVPAKVCCNAGLPHARPSINLPIYSPPPSLILLPGCRNEGSGNVAAGGARKGTIVSVSESRRGGGTDERPIDRAGGTETHQASPGPPLSPLFAERHRQATGIRSEGGEGEKEGGRERGEGRDGPFVLALGSCRGKSELRTNGVTVAGDVGAGVTPLQDSTFTFL